MELSILVTASPETLRWLYIVKAKILSEIPSVEYYEKMYWASFKNPSTDRNFVYLNPRARQIRLFTRLPASFDDKLEAAPSTGKWAETFPSIFKIRSELDIEKAVQLIKKSFAHDS